MWLVATIGRYGLAYRSSFVVSGFPHSCISALYTRANVFLDIQICSCHASSFNFPKTPHCLHNTVQTLAWQLACARPFHSLDSKHIKVTMLLDSYLSLLTSVLFMEGIPFSLVVSTSS